MGESSLGASIFPPDEGADARHVVGSRCPECGDVRFPARRLCPVDQAEAKQWLLRGEGVIYEAVRIDLAPQGFQPPYWVGYIDLDDGVRLFARVAHQAGEPEPAHGDRVRLTLGVVRTDQDGGVLGPVFQKVSENGEQERPAR